MPVRRLYQFTFFQINQHECTLNGTYHERTVILIEYQHSADHAGNIESNFQVTKQAVADFAVPSRRTVTATPAVPVRTRALYARYRRFVSRQASDHPPVPCPTHG